MNGHHGIASRREEELRRDPVSLFRSLPAVELSTDEVEAMRQRVSGVLRARGVAGGGRSADATGVPSPGSSERRRARALLGALATAAALLLAVGIGLGGDSEDPELAALAVASDSVAPGDLSLDAEDEARLEASLAARPLVEGVGLGTDGQQVRMQFALAELDLAFVSDAGLEL